MIKKIIILSFVLCLSFGFFTNISYAQEVPKDYTLLAPLPGITAPGQTTTNIQTYLPGAFTFLLGFAGLLAFVMISWSGFQYMTTDAVFGKSQAKENLTNAIYGLVLVLASYAILYTINPKILDFNLNLQRVPASQSGTVSASPTGNSCTNCKTLTSLNLPYTPGAGSNPQISESTGVKLQNLNTKLKDANINWAITEAFPPTITHQNPCHAAGTCVDARPSTQSATNVIKFQESAASVGLRAVYEVKTSAEASSLREAGYKGEILVLPDKLVNGVLKPQITGPHFSVYNN